MRDAPEFQQALAAVLANIDACNQAPTAAYTGAMMGADWPTYTFQSTITARLQDLDARIAAYADSDPSNDPPAAWNAPNQCALCHTH